MADPLLTLSVVLAVVLGGILLLWVQHCSPGWRGASKSGARLPKGSFGWPIIGETLAFARDPPKYASSHFKRFGKIFKSSVASQQLIMGTTPEFAKFVTSNSSLFISRGPQNLMEILGTKTFLFKDGPPHMSIKKLVQKAILPEALRTQVTNLETIILENMASWEQKGTIHGKDATEKITLDAGMWFITGVRDIGSTPEGKRAQENFELFNKGLGSFPINLPGTDYNKGLKSCIMHVEETNWQGVLKILRESTNKLGRILSTKAKAALTQYFKGLIDKRRRQKNSEDDMLGVLLSAQEDPQAREEVKDLDDETIAENLVLMWFGARDTTSITLTWVFKLLVDNPDVLRRIQAEQREILKSKDRSMGAPGLSWEDTKKMMYTQKFFQEVQRTLSIIPMVAREATQDIEYEGHLIPKGWGARPMFTFIHSDPTVYPDPKRFNPDRFDATPKPYTYLPFSAGPHICPGMELAKLISLIFIHHLTTTYIFESAGQDRGMEYIFFPTIRGGYPINICRQSKVDLLSS